MQNRIVLVRADEHRAQHGGAAGGKAELAAAAGAQLAGQHAQQQPGHGHGRDAAGQVDDGPQGRNGKPCGQIITQPREKQVVCGPAGRCGQRDDQQQRQAEIPDLRAVVWHELHQAGDTQRAGQDDILRKDGQHHIADKLHNTV